MKYIRTKDGIYDTNTMSISSLYDSGNFVKNVSYCKRIDDFTLLNIYEDDVIKQSDTIEELCDDFVVIHKELNGSHTVHRYNNWLGKSEHEAGNEVYGAIWTEWGLKYVAKMNEKGKLELL